MTIAVVSEPALPRYAELVSGLARVPVRALPAAPGDADELTKQLQTIADGYRAALLTHVDAERARRAQHQARDTTGLRVLTDQDATAIALTAALLAALARHDRTSRDVRVLVVGARTLPPLISLLIAADTRDLALWNLPDAAAFPLHQAIFGADVVIDLLGAFSAEFRETTPLTIITPDDAGTAPSAIAGILGAAARNPLVTCDIDVYRTAASALAAAHRAGQVSQHRARALATVVADAVSATLDPSPRPPGFRRAAGA
ncbi:hypothetical protein [Amycolatopsis sp. SID8362]|uniref:hypothetical protein n=1 Tax=Amycolatopsis sp. SID8362 TaxID=2690346 RepID=UPI00136D1668|nr:hypothetical protein [Amycolatopsis sp. SID8362]NBH06485.1 hypothetical protein [Amycolatopsis sp. SID8362]NED43182.1 hypothetical protein [Amycolatopsis sp. SID8362]